MAPPCPFKHPPLLYRVMQVVKETPLATWAFNEVIGVVDRREMDSVR